MTVKNRNPSLLTDTIGKNAIFVERGTGGQGASQAGICTALQRGACTYRAGSARYPARE